ncbi:suppressor of fused domain protein [Nocardia sp. NPDC051787]|uniref:suppressor of fused domain protein n=1 Tax=Nocardia sp. NPDC051787 TaxID=3155415 RepID=UPI00343D383F
MSAPPVLRGIYRDLQKTWGPEDGGYVFENGPGPVDRLDVLVYRPTDTVPMTLFATIGMSVEAMPSTPGAGGDQRAELRFGRRGSLSREEEGAVAKQLANIAIFPWNGGSGLAWGHVVGIDNDFPTFAGCRAVFLSGPLTENSQDCLWVGDDVVRILNVVPITEDERARARAMRPGDFIYELMDEVDIFSARSNSDAAT